MRAATPGSVNAAPNRAPEKFRRLLAARILKGLPAARVEKPALAPELGACLMAAWAGKEDASALFRRLAGHASKGDA